MEFEKPRARRPDEQPQPPPTTPYVPGDMAEYCVPAGVYMQIGKEAERRAPGSVLGVIQCDAAIDHLYLVNAIRSNLLVRKA